MSENTKIEWCDHTFNPWTGCTKVSPGCDHCYAEGWSKRAGNKVGKWGPGAPRVRTTPANWAKPVKWQANAAAFMAEHGRRQRVFCASLADVFDNEVPKEWRHELFILISETPDIDWLLLTKRIGNVQAMLPVWWEDPTAWACGSPMGNVWLGATITSQAEADRDIPKLLAVPARVRFLSMEPLLGLVDLERPRPGPDLDQGGGHKICQPWLIQSGIDWVIVGGESGPGARPMHPDWARSLRDQCASAGVPFLFKQWGEWIPASQSAAARLANGYAPIQEFDHLDGHRMHRIGKKGAGRLLDGVEHNGFPGGE